MQRTLRCTAKHCLVYDKFGKEHEERTGFEAILALYCRVCQFDFTEPYKKNKAELTPVAIAMERLPTQVESEEKSVGNQDAGRFHLIGATRRRAEQS